MLVPGWKKMVQEKKGEETKKKKKAEAFAVPQFGEAPERLE